MTAAAIAPSAAAIPTPPLELPLGVVRHAQPPASNLSSVGATGSSHTSGVLARWVRPWSSFVA
jgi:hypothetical protein